jgi:hypothetical protein
MSPLEEFYAILKGGITVSEFLVRFNDIFDFVHSANLPSKYRLAQKPVKRLRDEAAPMARFTQNVGSPNDVIKFAFDDGPIDCTLSSAGQCVRNIQITIAQGTARFYSMTELNEAGIAFGNLNVVDGSEKSEFLTVVEKGRVMYSTDAAKKTLRMAISRCIDKKSKGLGCDTLVIEAPLEILPLERFYEMVPTLSELAVASPFEEVFVVGHTENRAMSIKLK